MVSARENSPIARVAKLSWRRAEMRDALILLQWRNDPVSVMYSRSGATVSPEEHAGWLDSALQNKKTYFLISESDAIPIATCRFESAELMPNTHLVSINLAPSHRGHGISQELLTSAISHFFAEHSSNLLADIHKENIASERIFTRAGFRWMGLDGGFNRFLLPAQHGNGA